MAIYLVGQKEKKKVNEIDISLESECISMREPSGYVFLYVLFAYNFYLATANILQYNNNSSNNKS